ncbi:MAG TPA: NAD(P)-dependent oxidoreductase [Gemmatimonadales bacterium]
MRTEVELDELLSRPTAEDVAAAAALAGDLLIVGVSGKMGPSLARLARRASDQCGVARRVIGVARFRDAETREALEATGIETLACDLLDDGTVAELPDCPHVVYMAGHKFGTATDSAGTWATNVIAPAAIARRFRRSRIVAFSTGNVYPLTALGSAASESHPLGPVGEYAQSAVGRERVFEFYSRRFDIPMALLRLNYAVEPRYGVLRDVADSVVRRRPIDLTTGYVNVIWQRDANAVALRALAHCATPPLVLNVTGAPPVSIRDLALRFGAALGMEPLFRGTEAHTALLSDPARCYELFGTPPVTLEEMIGHVADWITAGGASLGKPTHYEEREGRF